MRTSPVMHNENGSITVLALLLLVLLTMIGLAGTTTTSTDTQISRNEKDFELAFFASEAATAYVAATPSLYGTANTTVGEGLDIGTQTLATTQSFDGTVSYLGSSAPPRGSGYAVGTFQAHKYRIDCTGYGPTNSNASSELEVGFYRIGF